MDRLAVLELVNGERNYQDSRWAAIHDKDHSVADWLIYIEHYLNKAKAAMYDLNEAKAMTEVRKLTALGVACMEHKDAPERIIE